MKLKHVCVRHAGMLTIIPDVAQIHVKDGIVSIIRANGKRFGLADVTEISSILTKQEKQ